MSGFDGFDVDALMRGTQPQRVEPIFQRQSDAKETGGNNNTKSNDNTAQSDTTGAVAQKPENSEVGEAEEPKKQPETTIPPRVRKPKKDVVQTKKTKSEVVQIRDFPRELIAQVRAEFPTATNNTDALAAYVHIKTGRSGNVSNEVQRLADEYEGDKSAENIAKRLSAIESSMSKQSASMQELELVIAFLVFDRLGFRDDVPKNPGSIDFLESGVPDVIKRMKEQAKMFRTQQNIKEGRPIR